MKDKSFKIKHGDAKVMSMGGFVFLDHLLDRSGLTESIDNQLPKDVAQQQYSYSKLLKSLLFTRLAGGESFEDLNYYRQELSEVTRSAVPSADTLARSLKKLSVDNHIFCDSKRFTVVETNFNQPLNDLLFSVAARSLPKLRGGHILDLDAHYVLCDKSDAQYCYKNAKAYSLMAATIGRHFVDLKVRNGNVSPKRGQLECLRRTLKNCQCSNINISAVRIDSAGYDFKMLDFLDRKGIRYYVRAPLSNSMEQKVAGRPNEYWHGEKDQLQWTEVDYQGRRYIVQRIITKKRQYNAFTETQYKYRAIVTNDRRKRADGAYVIDFYNQRAASERNFEYLNQDFASHRLPFAKMNHNATYLATMAILHNLFEWSKNQLAELTGQIDTPVMRAKRFRFRFAMVAARWRKRARRVFLEIYTPHHYPDSLVPT